MRIRRVTIEGFGPFKDAQDVDLTAFAEDGLFLIAGETGAGKSTILDAITYALYGDTPRWDDVNATPRFRSDYCGLDDPSRVVLEFETNGTEYRITRTPEYERPKARGAGTTTQKATALLERREASGWAGLADKPRDVASRVTDLVRLTQDEFLQVILLAQGRFQRFLLAPSDERLGLLSKLFGAQRFKDYQDRIAERRRALKDQTEAARTELRVLLGSVAADDRHGDARPGDELAWIDAVVDDALQDVRRAADDLARAAAALEEARQRRDVAERQHRRRVAEQVLADLDAHHAEVEERRARVETAERAERVRALADAVRSAAGTMEAAREAIARARVDYGGSAPDDALREEVTRLDRAIGALAEALADEQRAEQLERDLAAERATVDRLTTALHEDGERIQVLTDERTAVAAVAAGVDALERQRDDLAARVDAAAQAAAIAGELHAAHEAQLDAEAALTRAQAHATTLLDQHLHGQAAVLAATLADGEPCAVCGSREHPAPATAEADVVSRAEVDAARAEADRHDALARAARARVDELARTEARLRGLVGEHEPDALQAAFDEAQAGLAAALSARARVDAIDRELTGDTGLRARTAAAESLLSAATTQVTTLAATLAELRARTDLLRGDDPTVALRHERIGRELAAAASLADALDSERTAVGQLATTQAQLDAKATQEGFASADAAERALLDAGTLAAHRQAVAAHDEAALRARGQLASADLQDLPAEVVDLDEARAAVAAAEAGKDAAARAHTTAENAAAQLAEQRRRLRLLIDRSAGLAAEFDVLDRLASTVIGKAPNSTGMSLESYYVAAELETVLAAANGRLRTMTGGRYQLLHTERGILHANARPGLELEVMDEQTGRARDPHTLSGGEQFLASLALALGLAEVVTARAGGVELDTLFVDEGFGSLSPEFLEVAMATLDSLKAGGRTVGVISHVDAMKESIGAQLQVVRDPGGWSRVLPPA